MGDKGIVKNKIAPREDVLHFPNTYRERNGFWGISTLRFAFDTLSLIKTEGRLALETAAKGGRIKGIISEKQPTQGQGHTGLRTAEPRTGEQHGAGDAAQVLFW